MKKLIQNIIIFIGMLLNPWMKGNKFKKRDLNKFMQNVLVEYKLTELVGLHDYDVPKMFIDNKSENINKLSTHIALIKNYTMYSMKTGRLSFNGEELSKGIRIYSKEVYKICNGNLVDTKMVMVKLLIHELMQYKSSLYNCYSYESSDKYTEKLYHKVRKEADVLAQDFIEKHKNELLYKALFE